MGFISITVLALSLALNASAQDSLSSISSTGSGTATSAASTITSAPTTMSTASSSSATGGSSTVISILNFDTLSADSYYGSLIDVQNGLTTAAIAPLSFDSAVIGTSTPTITATFGPSSLHVGYQTQTFGVQASVDVACKITASTTGSCVVSAVASGDGTSTTTKTTTTVPSGSITSAPITLTAGNLAALTGSGTATTNTQNMAVATVAPKAAAAVGAIGLAAMLL